MKIVVENRKVARNWRKTKVLGGHKQSVFVSVDLKLVTWKDFHMATLSQGPGLCVRVYARRGECIFDDSVSSHRPVDFFPLV